MTKELERAARDVIHELYDDDHKVAVKRVARYMADFALAQLREQLAELERGGWLTHNVDYRCGRGIDEPCTCGWDEMKRELEQQ